MSADEPVKPEQKVCEKNVDVPTLLVEPFKEGDKPEVFVQWFGMSLVGMDLEEMQFRFPVPAPVGSHH